MRNGRKVIISGLAIRFALAPFTGHAYDMAWQVFSQRLYFEQGVVDLKYFPTLPVLYYLQVLSYTIYALLRILGMNDFSLFYHTSLAIEGVFLKLPFIISDLGIFLIIRSITHRLEPASLFFLNPLTIYISAAWGTYDSLMLLPLMGGFLLLQTIGKVYASVAFAMSGATKLFGVLPYTLSWRPL